MNRLNIISALAVAAIGLRGFSSGLAGGYPMPLLAAASVMHTPIRPHRSRGGVRADQRQARKRRNRSRARRHAR